MPETQTIPEIGEKMYEGKAKRVYATSDPTLCVISYKDDATAFNGLKKGQISGKGIINNRISNHLMKMLEGHGVKSHLVKELSETDSLVRRVEIVPLEVIVRNIAAGSLAKRLGLDEGVKMSVPVVEFCYKNDDLGDPMVNDSHILAMGWANESELALIRSAALKINDIMREYLRSVNIDLIDFKLEFGRLPSGEIVLADEISQDTCRFWDSTTGEKLDKDRFRRDMGGVEEAYANVRARLLGE